VAVRSGCFAPSNGATDGVAGLQLYWQHEVQGRSARRRWLYCCCWGRHLGAGGAATAAGARGNGEPMPTLNASIVWAILSKGMNFSVWGDAGQADCLRGKAIGSGAWLGFGYAY
jgi:hypothetical protein